MKYYSYSVKDMLKRHFGDDTVFEMRRPHDSRRNKEDEKILPQLMWQAADEFALSVFLRERFLINTVIEDDYIAYLYQFQNMKCVLLMFMREEKNDYFDFDAGYADELTQEWNSKGYVAYILGVSVYVDHYPSDRGFHLTYHVSDGKGICIYEVKRVNGKPLLVFARQSCWDYYDKKIMSVVKSSDIREYECLFEPDVRITRGHNKNRETISTGIDALMDDLLNANNDVCILYKRFEDTGTYTQGLSCGQFEMNLYVDRRNLISEVNINVLIQQGDDVIFDDDRRGYGSLIGAMPKPETLRVLETVQIHGYGLQIVYNADNVRNYYLCSFDDRSVPDECVIDGYIFNMDMLDTARLGKEGEVVFDNGYVIPAHILYYHSFRQVNIEKTDNVVYGENGIRIESLYRLPLVEFKGWFNLSQYWGTPEECYGPKEVWLDEKGDRLSDVALSCIRNDKHLGDATLVGVEPTFKFGFIRKDGSWLVPPIYTEVDGKGDDCVKAKRIIGDSEKTLYITKDGAEKTFDHEVDVDAFMNGRSFFNAAKTKQHCDYYGYYFYDDYDLTPGLWGIVDSDLNIVMEPKYVLTAGFWNGGGEHSVVARYVGEKLCWGVIDLNGNEVIPCSYPELYCRWGEAVAFKRDKSGPYGLMDFKGDILVEPMFDYIEAYDPEHRMVTAGASGDDLGVYSVDLGKMIIPEEFDCVDYGIHMISCEIRYTCKERFFDYDGNELVFDGYDSVYECNGNLNVWKDGKSGAIDYNGNVLIPPVLMDGRDRHAECYKRGFYISGEKKFCGLKKLSGEMIIPEEYYDISVYNNLVIASKCNDGNWCICDSLFTIDGKPVYTGMLRNIRISDNNNTMSIETPEGKEFFTIKGNQ